MIFGLDTRFLLIGLCVGLLATYLPSGWIPLKPAAPPVPSSAWGSTYHEKQHSQPIYNGAESDELRGVPPENLAPRVQRQLAKQQASEAEREEARIHAPVYFMASDGDKEPAMRRIQHELLDLVMPQAVFIISPAADAPTVQLASASSLPFAADDVFAAIKETDVSVRWGENEHNVLFEGLRAMRPTLPIRLPHNLDHRQALEVGTALHRFREQGVAFVIDSPAMAEAAKVVDAATHYSGTDRHRVVSAYKSPLLSLAAGAADEAEGEALMQAADAMPDAPLLLRFGFVEDQGSEIL